MGWLADDLHVRRLRRIWQEMSDSLGARTMRLDRNREKKKPETEHASAVTAST